jgi:hypothetical protein
MANTWQPGPLPSRRLTSRVETPDGVWVYWRCDGRDDVSPIRDMSMGGIFLETPKPRAVGTSVNLHFLIQEGQLRADATVRHVKAGNGLGLKFTAVAEEDRARLAALMTRVRGIARSRSRGHHES